MSTAYWAQYSHSEILSLHGVEGDEGVDEEIECDCEIDECNDECPICFGSGCNYCLML